MTILIPTTPVTITKMNPAMKIEELKTLNKPVQNSLKEWRLSQCSEHWWPSWQLFCIHQWPCSMLSVLKTSFRMHSKVILTSLQNMMPSNDICLYCLQLLPIFCSWFLWEDGLTMVAPGGSWFHYFWPTLSDSCSQVYSKWEIQNLNFGNFQVGTPSRFNMEAAMITISTLSLLY